MDRNHRHKAIPDKQEEYGFHGCVTGVHCNPASHGMVVCIDFCRCGAQRESNHCGYASEYGPWYDPDDED
ncbi:MAG: hypothetical protein ACLP9L_32870 [Thermoguttaceae bacterium]